MDAAVALGSLALTWSAMEGIDLGMQQNETILQKMHTMVHKVNN